jgi:hypothetical protein
MPLRKKPRVIKAVLTPNPAEYNPETHTIKWDARLEKFPKLKKAILEHELSHARDYPDVWKIAKREVIDYAKFKFSKETRLELAKYLTTPEFKRTHRMPLKKKLGILVMQFFLIFEVLVTDIFFYFYMTYLKIRKRI